MTLVEGGKVLPNSQFPPEMLKAAEVGDKERACLYKVFSTAASRGDYEDFITYATFSEIMTKYGLRPAYCNAYFHSVNTSPPYGLLNYDQFEAGIIAMRAPHGGPWLRERLGYIFSAYDINKDGVLDENELSCMVWHIRLTANMGDSGKEIMEDVAERMKLFNLTDGEKLTFERFLVPVVKHQFRGTSRLFRLPTIPAKQSFPSPFMDSEIDQHDAAQGGEEEFRSSTPTPIELLSSSISLPDSEPQEIAVGDVEEGLRSLVQHVTLNPRFVVISREETNLDSTSTSMMHMPSAEAKVDLIDPVLMARTPRPHHHEVAHLVIDALLHNPQGWVTPRTRAFTLISPETILHLCALAEDAMRKDQMCVRVSAPCKVYGDIHGQLPDLLRFFFVYGSPNHRTGDINLVNYLFLGDFVDRGEYSLEVVMLLFALKVRYPEQVYLVRGNHEDRGTNQLYGFLQECLERLGEMDGQVVWRRINDAFDYMPLSALVAGKIFCTHGGIGADVRTIEQIDAIQRPVSFADERPEHTAICDLLWSDPTGSDKVLGVHANPPRGQGMHLFGPDRVEVFCADNGVELIVRAHECVAEGYQFFAGGRLVTIFSATNYKGSEGNSGAFLEITNKLQITPKVIKPPPNVRPVERTSPGGTVRSLPPDTYVARPNMSGFPLMDRVHLGERAQLPLSGGDRRSLGERGPMAIPMVPNGPLSMGGGDRAERERELMHERERAIRGHGFMPFRDGRGTPDMPPGAFRSTGMRGPMDAMRGAMDGSGSGMRGMDAAGMRAPMDGPGMRGPMDGAGMRGPIDGSGMRGAMDGSGMRGAMDGPGMRGAMDGAGMRGAMDGAGMRGAMDGAGMRGAMDGAGMRGIDGSGIRGPMDGPGMRGSLRGGVHGRPGSGRPNYPGGPMFAPHSRR